MTDRVAVEAALRRLGRDLGRVFTLDDVRPDEVNRLTKDVDFIARTDQNRTLAIEHTQIGPFNDHERLHNEMPKILGPMCDELEGLLPAGSRFHLSISAGVAPRLTAKAPSRIKAWITATAPTLGQPPRHFADSPLEVGVACRLYRWDESAGVGPRLQLLIGFMGDEEVERLRVVRSRRALEDKLPKLEAARNLHAVKETMLALESSDHQASNAWAIAAAVRSTTQALPLPDHIVLVEVGQGHPHPLTWVVRLAGVWLADDDLSPSADMGSD